MSNLSQFTPFSGGGASKLRYQIFTSSGTFTPSAALLAAGGQVFLELRGGGGGPGYSGGCFPQGSGGGSSFYQTSATVSGATAVTVGAGGAANADGGTTSFGAASVLGGYSAISNSYGAGSGLGQPGNFLAGGGMGGAAMPLGSFNGTSYDSGNVNTGGGGSAGLYGGLGNGGSGIVKVWWFE